MLNPVSPLRHTHFGPLFLYTIADGLSPVSYHTSSPRPIHPRRTIEPSRGLFSSWASLDYSQNREYANPRYPQTCVDQAPPPPFTHTSPPCLHQFLLIHHQQLQLDFMSFLRPIPSGMAVQSIAMSSHPLG